MTGPIRLAATLCGGGAALGSAAIVGLIGGQTRLARRRIPAALLAPPLTHGTIWRARRATRGAEPLRLALLGDSMAAGYGVDDPRHTLAAQLAVRISAATRRPVHVLNHARVGARSCDLRAQLAELAGGPRPDLAVILVGANDVTHRVRISDSVRHLAYATHRLHLMDATVVVGTCPDLGTVRAIGEPLRSLAQRMGRALAGAQADVARRAGAVPVPLGALLGDRFRAEATMFGPDGFHPSAAGYEAAADALFPALGVVRGERTPAAAVEVAS